MVWAHVSRMTNQLAEQSVCTFEGMIRSQTFQQLLPGRGMSGWRAVGLCCFYILCVFFNQNPYYFCGDHVLSKMCNLYKNVCPSQSVADGAPRSHLDGFQDGARLEPDWRLSFCHQLEVGQS